ncbi:hypothetical protein BpHYR1_000654 [Brachionus plicatilis]|uniref:Uncharacterized protein n=1 Tax=Brachionus plicatilis TaxID=10195 RepID=A0A3M7SHH2_BRAPC|nr:hypothetical protein BpHYR1_000654 [Brachionus plicatilis]
MHSSSSSSLKFSCPFTKLLNALSLLPKLFESMNKLSLLSIECKSCLVKLEFKSDIGETEDKSSGRTIAVISVVNVGLISWLVDDATVVQHHVWIQVCLIICLWAIVSSFQIFSLDKHLGHFFIAFFACLRPSFGLA